MKRLLILSSVLMAVLLLPALASATHVTNLVAIADCEGFTAQVDVHFRSTADFLDLHYEVAVMDDDMEIVMISGDLHILQDGEQDISFIISELFNTALDGAYVVNGTISLTSPYPGGVDEDMVEFSNPIECGSVANDEVSFESLKALYR